MMKLILKKTVKNIIISPLLFLKAIITGTKEIAYEFASVIRQDYSTEHLITVIMMLIELFISVSVIIFLPFAFSMYKSFVYYISAGVHWLGFIILYSLTEKRYKAYAKDVVIWDYLGDTAPLFIIAVDTIAFLILGIIL